MMKINYLCHAMKIRIEDRDEDDEVGKEAPGEERKESFTNTNVLMFKTLL